MRIYNFKVSAIMLILISLLGYFLYGCQNESDEEAISANLPYLSFDEYPGTEISDLSENDLESLVLAFKRINLKMEDGLYSVDTRSAAQINISENLFCYFENLVEINNKKILKEGLSFSLVPRTRNGGEGGNTSNDCVAQAVTNIAKQMGSSMNLSEVKKWIEKKYGTNGGPSSKISEVLSHYFVYGAVSIRDGYTPPSGRQVFVVIKGGGNEGHAARYISCSGGIVLCHDGFYQLSQVTHSYLINGVR